MKGVIISVAALLLFSATVHAQDEKNVGEGDSLVGASVNISHQWVDASSVTLFNLNTDVGYF